MQSSKTAQTLELQDLHDYSKISTRSFTMRKGTLYLHVPSVEFQEGKEFILLPTVTKTFDSLPKPLPPRKKNPNGGQCKGLLSVVNGPIKPNLAEYILDIPENWTMPKEREEIE